MNCLYNAGKPSCFLWGAEQNAAGNGADKGFHGAMEEMFLAKLSLENITAHLYSCPACGCNNFIYGTTLTQQLVNFGPMEQQDSSTRLVLRQASGMGRI